MHEARVRARYATSTMAESADGSGGQQAMLARNRKMEEQPVKKGWFPLGVKEGFSQWVGCTCQGACNYANNSSVVQRVTC